MPRNCRIIHAIAILTGLFSVDTAKAQQNSAGVITLQQALDLARENYPLIKSRMAEVDASQADAKGVVASYLPKAGVQTQALFATSNQVRGAYYSYDGLAVPVSGVRTDGFDSRASWSSLAAITMDWKAVTFGRKQADKALAGAKISLAQQQLEQDIFQHQVKVIDAYLQVLNLQKLTSLQERNTERTENILSVTRANAASGLKAGIDSSVAAMEATKAKIQWMNTQNMTSMQQVVLAELLGRPGEVVQIDTMAFYQRLPQKSALASADNLDHPLLGPLASKIQISEDAAQTIRMNTMPTLSLLGSLWGRGSGIAEQVDAGQRFDINNSLGSGLNLRAFNYVVGATLTWQPSRYIEMKHRYHAQKQQSAALKQNYQLVKQQLTTAQKNALLQFDLAYNVAQQTPLQLAAAKKAYAQSNARYTSGLENIILLTQVADLFIKSEVDYLVSVNTLWRTLLIRAASEGNLDVFLEQVSN